MTATVPYRNALDQTSPDIERAPIRNGLRDISIEEFWKDPLVIANALERKLCELPIDGSRHPFLARQMLQVMHLLRAVGLRHYGAISLLAVVDILETVDYFLLLCDEKPDSRDDGYDDDAAKIRATFARHQKEIDDFRVWFSRQS